MSEGYEVEVAVGDLDVGQMCLVVAGDREVVLCSTPTGIYAVDALCTHAHAFLDEGVLEGHEIECPLHGARFDVRTGDVVRRPATERLGTYDIALDATYVSVRVS